VGGKPADQAFFTGMERVVPMRELDAFVATAGPGDRFVYAEVPFLRGGETADHARSLAQEGYVTTHQERRQGGGRNYFVMRTRKPAATSRRGRPPNNLSEELDTIFRAIKRAANLNQPCPTDSELAKLAGLASRDQAQWRVRELIRKGLIESVLAYENCVPMRVVTITATGRTTALPTKWAALQTAAARDAAGGVR
jgi:hypothetical protein